MKYKSKVTTNTPERRQWRRFDVFIVNFQHIPHLDLSVFVVNIERVITDWVSPKILGDVFKNLSSIDV